MPRRVKLPSPPATSNPNIVGFTVGVGGVITDAPSKFAAHRNDIVTWIVGNTSGQPITVSLVEFFRKSSDSHEKGDSNDEITPFIWIVSETLQLEDGKAGFIAGRRDPTFQIRGFFHDAVSYTIQVRSRASSGPFDPIDYDPDGDIKP